MVIFYSNLIQHFVPHRIPSHNIVSHRNCTSSHYIVSVTRHIALGLHPIALNRTTSCRIVYISVLLDSLAAPSKPVIQVVHSVLYKTLGHIHWGSRIVQFCSRLPITLEMPDTIIVVSQNVGGEWGLGGFGKKVSLQVTTSVFQNQTCIIEFGAWSIDDLSLLIDFSLD